MMAHFCKDLLAYATYVGYEPGGFGIVCSCLACGIEARRLHTNEDGRGSSILLLLLRVFLLRLDARDFSRSSAATTLAQLSHYTCLLYALRNVRICGPSGTHRLLICRRAYPAKIHVSNFVRSANSVPQRPIYPCMSSTANFMLVGSSTSGYISMCTVRWNRVRGTLRCRFVPSCHSYNLESDLRTCLMPQLLPLSYLVRFTPFVFSSRPLRAAGSALYLSFTFLTQPPCILTIDSRRFFVFRPLPLPE